MGMFADAKTLETAKPKSKKTQQERVVVAGLEALASIDAVIKSLEAIKAVKMTEVKDQMAEKFIKDGIDKNDRPENFRGLEGNAEASCELRARSSNSPLSDEEIAKYEEHNLPITKIETVVETFVINPEYLADVKVMSSIEAALKKVKGIPDDLFLRQQGVTKTVAGEDAIKMLFAGAATEEEVTEMLPLVGVLAVKPTLASDDLAAAFKIAAAIISPAAKKK
jgi:hypothetical protein